MEFKDIKDIISLVISFVNVIAWPITTILLSIFIALLFRTPISYLIKNLKITVMDVKIEAQKRISVEKADEKIKQAYSDLAQLKKHSYIDIEDKVDTILDNIEKSYED